MMGRWFSSEGEEEDGKERVKLVELVELVKFLCGDWELYYVELSLCNFSSCNSCHGNYMLPDTVMMRLLDKIRDAYIKLH